MKTATAEAPGPAAGRRRWPGAPAVVVLLASLLLAAGASPTSAVLAHRPGTAHVSHRTPQAARVGALFRGSLASGHFCTASVVDSPGRSLVLTAAHCLDDPGAGGDLLFVPGYRNGTAPHGVWHLARTFTDPRWDSDGDEDADVAFAVVSRTDGARVEDAVGGNRLGASPADHARVRLTGYPDSGEEPLTCTNTATRISAGQLRIACSSYSQGTSGSPWVTGTDRADPARTGTVVGVIGGHEQGGDTDEVSYSSVFGPAVTALYRRAVAAGG
ncbi:trypsin-like serine peptidase [Streptomyces sp. NPDC001380]|uniref:trypsin-like serine peptidase n=1 Tax=Streptomyces sp. NPDC001380 TaxID=3364566 RepID=UPI0036BE9F9F